MCVVALRYAAFGRVFRVERSEASGRWSAVGRAAGQPSYVLDKLGDAETEQAMQGKLDAWAKRQGARAVNMPRPQQDLLDLATGAGGGVSQ